MLHYNFYQDHISKHMCIGLQAQTRHKQIILCISVWLTDELPAAQWGNLFVWVCRWVCQSGWRQLCPCSPQWQWCSCGKCNLPLWGDGSPRPLDGPDLLVQREPGGIRTHAWKKSQDRMGWVKKEKKKKVNKDWNVDSRLLWWRTISNYSPWFSIFK